MKTILPLLTLCLLVTLFGCSNRKRQQLAERIDKLEEQRSNDMAQQKQIDERIMALVEQFNTNLDGVESNQYDAQTDLLFVKLDLWSDESKITQLSNSIIILEGIRPNARPSQTAASQLKNGIPADIYNEIAADAARRFPTDYDEQVFIINEQVTAWKQLHGH